MLPGLRPRRRPGSTPSSGVSRAVTFRLRRRRGRSRRERVRSEASIFFSASSPSTTSATSSSTRSSTSTNLSTSRTGLRGNSVRCDRRGVQGGRRRRRRASPTRPTRLLGGALQRRVEGHRPAAASGSAASRSRSAAELLRSVVLAFAPRPRKARRPRTWRKEAGGALENAHDVKLGKAVAVRRRVLLARRLSRCPPRARPLAPGNTLKPRDVSHGGVLHVADVRDGPRGRDASFHCLCFGNRRDLFFSCEVCRARRVRAVSLFSAGTGRATGMNPEVKNGVSSS